MNKPIPAIHHPILSSFRIYMLRVYNCIFERVLGWHGGLKLLCIYVNLKKELSEGYIGFWLKLLYLFLFIEVKKILGSILCPKSNFYLKPLHFRKAVIYIDCIYKPSYHFN